MTDHYFEPLKNFRFRVIWDGSPVVGIRRIGTLRRTTEVVRHSEGGEALASRKSPGKTEYDAIILERGISNDRAFEAWANQVWSLGGDGRARKEFRKDVILEVYDDAGQLALVYRLLRCWVSEYQALPDLDAGAAGIAVETIKLETEGWVRDPGGGHMGAVPSDAGDARG
ncbi:phage tail protein [Vineibacter terrae]|uniref:Phage tail protein n=1 Tax=Vineibacter terrae TaxID=2586908 RepID=A0A5C8P9X6_9HYPH|nr:phage tail protein [Vineibacter terrae]TXL69794.1 phage tail protein [Vineibacter terrae]